MTRRPVQISVCSCVTPFSLSFGRIGVRAQQEVSQPASCGDKRSLGAPPGSWFCRRRRHCFTPTPTPTQRMTAVRQGSPRALWSEKTGRALRNQDRPSGSPPHSQQCLQLILEHSVRTGRMRVVGGVPHFRGCWQGLASEDRPVVREANSQRCETFGCKDRGKRRGPGLGRLLRVKRLCHQRGAGITAEQ